MDLDLLTYRSAITSHAQGLGLFGNVLDHEPVSAPGNGLSFAVWVKNIRPIPARSGLASVSVRLEVTGRVYMPADTEPLGDVDLEVTGAVNGLFNAYCGDFQLGGSVAEVDLLGQYGATISADLGYTRFNSTTYRVASVVVPLIINDLWTEAP
ncbi:hypothetical protein [Streptomyces shenzhenensis]|uniref:hypothetical protein n=1 Tax=Streptomyces shenzhenensis TaxID=943815 RepID=UPI0036A5855A